MDISRYLTFHNGGNFNIGCNVNTTIIAMRLEYPEIDGTVVL